MADQLPSTPRDNLLARPSPRGSMTAVGLVAAITVHRRGRDAVVDSFAADHIAVDRTALADAICQAIRLTEQDWVAIIGVKIIGPSTAFGYIHVGDSTDVPGASDGYRVPGFTEGPDADTAATYPATGDCRWNVGMFVVRVGVLLNHLAELRPQLAQSIEAIIVVWGAPKHEGILAERWPALGKIAIDHAIAEPVAAAEGVAIVPVFVGWNSIGGFDALIDLVPPRTQGSTTGAGVLDDIDGTDGSTGTDITGDTTSVNPRTETRAFDLDGVLVVSPSGRTVALLGMPGTVTIDTPDILLVTTLGHAQDIKGVVDALKAADREDLLQRTITPRA